MISSEAPPRNLRAPLKPQCLERILRADLDYFPGPGTMPVIAIPLASGPLRARWKRQTVQPIQTRTWTHPYHRPTLIYWDIQIGERRLVFSRATANPDFSGSPDTSVCRLRAKARSGNGDFDRPKSLRLPDDQLIRNFFRQTKPINHPKQAFLDHGFVSIKPFDHTIVGSGF